MSEHIFWRGWRDLSGGFSPSADLWLGRWCVRIFLRNRKLFHAYAYHRYGFYGIGAGLIGLMIWPPEKRAAAGGNRQEPQR